MYIFVCSKITSLFPDFLLYQASITVSNSSKPGICASCTLFADSTAEGCAIKLQNKKHTFAFNMSRQSNDELELLECFLVPEAGRFNVYVYEIQLGGVMEHTKKELPNIIITDSEK